MSYSSVIIEKDFKDAKEKNTVNSHLFDGVGTETDHLFDGARGPHSDAMLMSDCHATSAAWKGKWREIET